MEVLIVPSGHPVLPRAWEQGQIMMTASESDIFSGEKNSQFKIA